MRPAARVLLPFIVLVALAAGCGGRFQLPTQQTVRVVPTNHSYQMLATWKNLNGIHDVLMTRGSGEQLFLLFNHGGNGGPATARGEVQLYPFTQPTPIGPPFFYPLRSLFNPVALASAQSRLFVLDLGDSCMAKFDPVRSTCVPDMGDTTHNGRGARPNIVYDYSSIWRVREYSISGGDTISTFTDTTFQQPEGIAADDNGNVYVSGYVAVLDTDQTDHRIRTRRLLPRIYRYARGPQYPGVIPIGQNMPGANWHRDTTWVVKDGTGMSTVADPHRIVWSPIEGGALLVADSLNNKAKLIGTYGQDVGLTWMSGADTPSQVLFSGPNAVAMDEAGYLYIVDRGNQRVVRYDIAGNYVQDVNVENNSDNLPLLGPGGLGVDDSIAYVADISRAQVIRYKRRP